MFLTLRDIVHDSMLYWLLQPFTGEHVDNHETGVYTCVCCHAPLFRLVLTLAAFLVQQPTACLAQVTLGSFCRIQSVVPLKSLYTFPSLADLFIPTPTRLLWLEVVFVLKYLFVGTACYYYTCLIDITSIIMSMFFLDHVSLSCAHPLPLHLPSMQVGMSSVC